MSREYIKTEAGFAIFKHPDGFRIADLSTVNCWGAMSEVAPDLDTAERYAWACKDFKEGRTMRPPRWAITGAQV